MKNNREFLYRYRTGQLLCIIWAGLVSCGVCVAGAAAMSALHGLAQSGGWNNALIEMLGESDPVITAAYLFVGITIFCTVFYVMQRKSVDRIEKLSDVIHRISEGELDVEADAGGDDEFSVMARNINAMTADIRQLMDREREAERTKNELITNVAHDIRTPLTSVIGYLEILSKEKVPLSEETKKKYIDIAYSKAAKLEKLTEDLFGFTKLGYGKLALNVDRLDIIKLVGQLLEESYPSFQRNGISYELKSNIPVCMINGDGKLLSRLFENLIGNAIKYGADGKFVGVQIEADTEGKCVSVAVTNYGHVIPAAELGMVFDKFYRVERSRSSSTGGTGLGLAIAKNIAELHSGSIGVKSDMEGTVFTVVLPTDFNPDRENFGSQDKI